jgi:hypothetical protein
LEIRGKIVDIIYLIYIYKYLGKGEIGWIGFFLIAFLGGRKIDVWICY